MKSFRVTGGVSTVDFLQLDARYTDANFRSNAGRLTLQTTVGNLFGTQLNGRFPFKNVLPTLDASSPKYLQPTFQLNAEVRRRWLSDFRNQTGISVFGYRRSSPGVFVDQGGGAGGELHAQCHAHGAGQRAVPARVHECQRCRYLLLRELRCLRRGLARRHPAHAAPGPIVIECLNRPARRPDRPNAQASPGGQICEFANRWTGSQFGYSRAEIEATRYFHASPKLTIAVHGRAGYVRGQRAPGDSVPIILPRKRFYAGGARSVRGYGENQLGPRVLVIPRSVFQPTVAGFDSLLADTTLRAGRLPCGPGIDLPLCRTAKRRRAADWHPADVELRGRRFHAEASRRIDPDRRRRSKRGTASGVRSRSRRSLMPDRSVPISAAPPTVFTPGIGIRYLSPVGPIRIDVGYNPRSRNSSAS